MIIELKIKKHKLKRWYKNSVLHRGNDLPATIWPDGAKVWFRNGVRDRGKGLPAVIYPDGNKEWWEKGMLLKYTDQQDENNNIKKV